MSEDFFSEANVANPPASPYFKLKKIGDKCRGFLVSTSVRDNDMKPGTKQTVYKIQVPKGEMYQAYLKGDEMVEVKEGETIDVYGRMPIERDGQTVSIAAGVDNAKIGQMIGFKFTEERKTEKGFSAKIMQGYKSEEIDETIAGTAMSSETEGQPF